MRDHFRVGHPTPHRVPRAGFKLQAQGACTRPGETACKPGIGDEIKGAADTSALPGDARQGDNAQQCGQSPCCCTELKNRRGHENLKRHLCMGLADARQIGNWHRHNATRAGLAIDVRQATAQALSRPPSMLGGRRLMGVKRQTEAALIVTWQMARIRSASFQIVIKEPT